MRKGTHKRAHCSTRYLVKRASIRTTRRDYTQASFATTVTAISDVNGGRNV